MDRCNIRNGATFETVLDKRCIVPYKKMEESKGTRWCVYDRNALIKMIGYLEAFNQVLMYQLQVSRNLVQGQVRECARLQAKVDSLKDKVERMRVDFPRQKMN